MSIHFILGGARSGKSSYAETLATASNLPVTYIATAQIYDDEFAERVTQHKSRRPKHWQLVEAPFNLAQTLTTYAKEGECIIVDCLTLWLAQCICLECAPPEGVNWNKERADLLAILPKLLGTIILVSNEVGMGIVPVGAINRQFQDEQGRLNQAIAKVADRVSLITAGIPLQLKG